MDKKVKNYKFKTKPYAHQIKALELSWDKPYYAYFMEMGTGKSKVLLDNIAMLYDAGKINGPGEKIIWENSGKRNLNSPYLEALIILIFGEPALVPGSSCIT